jgi:hypothetical protein
VGHLLVESLARWEKAYGAHILLCGPIRPTLETLVSEYIYTGSPSPLSPILIHSLFSHALSSPLSHATTMAAQHLPLGYSSSAASADLSLCIRLHSPATAANRRHHPASEQVHMVKALRFANIERYGSLKHMRSKTLLNLRAGNDAMMRKLRWSKLLFCPTPYFLLPYMTHLFIQAITKPLLNA